MFMLKLTDYLRIIKLTMCHHYMIKGVIVNVFLKSFKSFLIKYLILQIEFKFNKSRIYFILLEMS
jgi:hypothetical protein